ncbi:MAG: hypothetical protein ACR2HP_08685 [Ilumatobacteraceae bacterium]
MGDRSISDREWVASRLGAGATITELAGEAGVSRQTAHTWLARHGMRGLSKAKERPPDSRLRELYEEHRTINAVAQIIGVATGTAHRWLIDAGVELASPGRAKRELDVAALRARRASGATFNELAADCGVSSETIRRRLTGAS